MKLLDVLVKIGYAQSSAKGTITRMKKKLEIVDVDTEENQFKILEAISKSTSKYKSKALKYLDNIGRQNDAIDYFIRMCQGYKIDFDYNLKVLYSDIAIVTGVEEYDCSKHNKSATELITRVVPSKINKVMKSNFEFKKEDYTELHDSYIFRDKYVIDKYGFEVDNMRIHKSNSMVRGRIGGRTVYIAFKEVQNEEN